MVSTWSPFIDTLGIKKFSIKIQFALYSFIPYSKISSIDSFTMPIKLVWIKEKLLIHNNAFSLVSRVERDRRNFSRSSTAVNKRQKENHCLNTYVTLIPFWNIIWLYKLCMHPNWIFPFLPSFLPPCIVIQRISLFGNNSIIEEDWRLLLLLSLWSIGMKSGILNDPYNLSKWFAL